ncbi:translation factor Sua5, partial [Staphylococcus aureus]|nr:translation factor Sua5 [Staphylococcus aureus]
MDTKIWDVREYNEDIQQYPKINEIKDIVLNGGLIG